MTFTICIHFCGYGFDKVWLNLSYDDITMGKYALAHEVDRKEHALQRRTATTFTLPTVTTLAQRRRIESIQRYTYSCIMETLKSTSRNAPRRRRHVTHATDAHPIAKD